MAAESFDRNADIGCILISGSEKAFAAKIVAVSMGVTQCQETIIFASSLTGYGGGIERKRWLVRHKYTPVPVKI